MPSASATTRVEEAVSGSAGMAAVRDQPEWEILRRQIYAHAVHFIPEMTFDFREMLTDARNAEMAGRLMWQLIKPFEPSVLAGPGFGAAPLLFATAAAALRDGVTVHVLMVRDQRKEHAQKKLVEGRRQPAQSRTVIIDDLMNSGSTLAMTEEALFTDGHVLDIRGAGIFYDMWQPHGSRQVSLGKYPVVSIFRRHDIGLTRDCFDARPPKMKGDYPNFILGHQWWRYDLNSDAEHPYKSAPAIADGAVFAADDQARVWRHNARDGAIEWRYDSMATPAKGIVQRLQYAEGSLVFGCYDGTVTRLDGRSGGVIWRWRHGTHVHATPELDLANQRVFVNTELLNGAELGGDLLALDWRTGKALWRKPHGYLAPGSPVYDAVANRVVAACNDETLVCVDADTGAVRWKTVTQGLFRGKPAVAFGRAYLATENGLLQCFDLTNGTVAWSRAYGPGEGHQFISLHGDRVLVLDGKCNLISFDASDGSVRWMSRMRSPGCWCPVPYGRYLVVLSRGGELAVFDPQMERKVWESDLGGYYRQPPALAHGIFAAASNNDGLIVYRINHFYDE